jgi:DNA repair exonuclease SbcCD ATPase subunit
MRFEYLDKFRESKKKKHEELKELARREKASLEEVQALKARYERIIRESLTAKKDATKELDALSDQIEKAEKTFERRQHERRLFRDMRSANEISAQDVVDKWNAEFVPQFLKEKRDPALERMLAAKKELEKATEEYFDVIAQFDNEKQAVQSELGGWGSKYYYKLRDIDLKRRLEIVDYFSANDKKEEHKRGEVKQFYITLLPGGRDK